MKCVWVPVCSGLLMSTTYIKITESFFLCFYISLWFVSYYRIYFHSVTMTCSYFFLFAFSQTHFPVSPPESLLHCHHANGQGCRHQRGGQANIQRKRQWPKGKLSFLPQYKLVRHQNFEKNQSPLVILQWKGRGLKTFRLYWLYNRKSMIDWIFPMASRGRIHWFHLWKHSFSRLFLKFLLRYLKKYSTFCKTAVANYVFL